MIKKLISYLTRSDFEIAAEKLLKLSIWAGEKNFSVLRGSLEGMSSEFLIQAEKDLEHKRKMRDQ